LETEQFLNTKYPDFLASQTREWIFSPHSWFRISGRDSR
jgi:hypothetical protein